MTGWGGGQAAEVSCSALLSPHTQRWPPLWAALPSSETLSTGNYSCCMRGHFALISPYKEQVIPPNSSETKQTWRILVSPLKAVFPKQSIRQRKTKPVPKLISVTTTWQRLLHSKDGVKLWRVYKLPFGGLFQAGHKSSISTGKVTVY